MFSKLKMFFIAAIAVAMVPASAGAKTREVVKECPHLEGEKPQLFVAQVYCQRPGQWFHMVADCVFQGPIKFVYQCDTEAKPEGRGQPVLMLEVGLSGGAMGFGSGVTGIGLFRLGAELRPSRTFGVLAEFRIGVSGKLFKEQPGDVSSYVGGAAFFTWRPADAVRLALGASGFTVRTTSWTKAATGVAGSARVDFKFARDWSFGIAGDMGPGWDPCGQSRKFWMVTGGISYTPPVLNTTKDE